MTLLGDRGGGVPAGHQAAPEEDAAFWVSLVDRIGQADHEAEAELALHFHDRIRVMASVRLRGSDGAFDVAQETILAALEALRAGSLRQPEKLPAFVLGIARNIINNRLRTAARSREVPADAADPPEEPAVNALDAGDDRRSLVREALKGLQVLDRRILLLTLIQGMTPREIAPIVSLSSEAVRTRKSRALKAIAGRIRRATRKRRWNHIRTNGPRP